MDAVQIDLMKQVEENRKLKAKLAEITSAVEVVRGSPEVLILIRECPATTEALWKVMSIACPESVKASREQFGNLSSEEKDSFMNSVNDLIK